jgi:hypothetical protein
MLCPVQRGTLNHWTTQVSLSEGPNRVGVSVPSTEDGSRSSFRNAMFLSS